LIAAATSPHLPRRRRPLSPRLSRALLALAAVVLAVACQPSRGAPPGGPVVLITLDALRADMVGGLGGEPGLTPNLDALIRRSDWAGRAIAPSSWEVPAMASLFTGLSPWQHHAVVDGNARLADDLITLPKAFQALGYRTTAFSSGRWYTAENGYSRGFDSFDVLGRNRDASEHLASLEEGKELVWVHLLEPAAPYERRTWLLPRLAGEPAAALLPPTVEPLDLETASNPVAPPAPALRRRLGAMYRLNVAWADEKIGRLLAALAESGEWDRSLVVVTSAFGEELGEHGLFGHGGDLERESLEVPLIVKLPAWYRRPLGAPRHQRVALARLWATLVEAAGGQPPPAMAPSLFRRAPSAVLSELYFLNGYNLFSLVDGDDQLLWQARFAPAEPRYRQARLEVLEGTADAKRPDSFGAIASRLYDAYAATPPLAGAGPPRLTLVRWLTGQPPASGGSRRVAGPASAAMSPDPLEAALARRLSALWGDFLTRQLAPEEEDRAWLDQLPGS
jgi:hypothetical protein